MTTLDELIREALIAEATDHDPPGDLATNSIRAGRVGRRRRRLATASVSVVSCAALVTGAVVIAHALGRSTQRVAPAGRASGLPGSNRSVRESQPPTPTPSPAQGPHSVPSWSTWPTNRTYGTPPPAGFFDDLPADARLLASGTMPDGIDFRISTDPHGGLPIDDLYGFGDQHIFGDQPGAGSPEYRQLAPYFAIETMTARTWDNGNEDHQGGFWLIVVGQPDTTTASYSADGLTWQPMHVENGIAVIELEDSNAAIPRASLLRLDDRNGPYAYGPVDLL
jgi:hypothetical protein